MKKYKISDAIIAGSLSILLILVIYQSITHDHFRNNAGKWVQPSINRNNIVDINALTALTGNLLLIGLSGQSQPVKGIPAIGILPGNILEKQNFKRLHDHKGKIILVSNNQAEAARIWMLLSQMGIQDLYILEFD